MRIDAMVVSSPAHAGGKSKLPSLTGQTIGSARQRLIELFRSAGIDSPGLDARLLIAHGLDLDHAGLAAAARHILNAEEANTIAALARRRLAREPVARILGCKAFWNFQLCVNAATLVPRPETETVVEAALAEIDAAGLRTRPLRIADLGTGSGALLLALLSELPSAAGVGTDVSQSATMMARDNARRLRLTRAAFVVCDMAAALRGPFDLIVANPPYIPTGDIAALAPEVHEFDPRLALDGGADGLVLYRNIAATTGSLLAPSGALVVELGAGQAEPVAALFAAGGLAPSRPRPDLMGVPRALVAKRAA